MLIYKDYKKIATNTISVSCKLFQSPETGEFRSPEIRSLDHLLIAKWCQAPKPQFRKTLIYETTLLTQVFKKSVDSDPKQTNMILSFGLLRKGHDHLLEIRLLKKSA